MLKFGNITNISYTNGTARVKFNQDGIVSKYLPISVRKTLNDKETFPYDINEQVWCVMDISSENGIIGGSLYSKNTKPSGAGEGITAIEYENGDRFEYDKQNRTFTKTINTTEQVINQNGHTIRRGSDTLMDIITDIINAALADIYPTLSGNSGTTLNSQVWNDIQVKVNNLFEN